MLAHYLVMCTNLLQCTLNTLRVEQRLRVAVIKVRQNSNVVIGMGVLSQGPQALDQTLDSLLIRQLQKLLFGVQS